MHPREQINCHVTMMHTLCVAIAHVHFTQECSTATSSQRERHEQQAAPPPCSARLVASESGEASTSDASASWAHLLPAPEPGCILLSNPLLFADTQQYFQRCVILVTDHSPQGSRGVILNKVFDSRVRLKDAEDIELEGSEFECFGDCVVHLGGDVPDTALVSLHPHALPHAREVRSACFRDCAARSERPCAELHLERARCRARTTRYTAQHHLLRWCAKSCWGTKSRNLLRWSPALMGFMPLHALPHTCSSFRTNACCRAKR